MKIKKWFLLLILVFNFGYSQQKLDVFFDFDQFNINQETLVKLNTWIISNNNAEVVKIYGFCDDRGSNVYNDSLSLKRIETIFNFLKNNKIAIDSSYQIKGFGENFEQDKLQAINRKVTIIFQEKKIKTPAIPLKIIPKTLVEKIQNANLGDKIVLENINFRNNSAAIMPNSKGILYDLLCIMEENQNLKIEIQGHICCQLIEDYNQVSTARARAIYQFLIRNKINRKRMTYKGFGVQFPIFKIPEKNENEENQNRRVEILILAH